MTFQKFAPLFALIMLASFSAFAQGKKKVSSSEPTYSYSNSSSKMILSPAFGFYGGTPTIQGSSNGATTSLSQNLSGIFGLGTDFEMMIKDDMSWGGFFRYYNTTDSIANQDNKVSLMTLGPLIRGYLDYTSWLVHFGTGVGVAMMEGKVGNVDINADMSFGFMMSWGVFYKYSPTLNLGVENMRMIAIGDKLNGWILNDFMFKARFAL